METPEERNAARVPAGGFALMIAMLVVFALVAIFANVQRARRDKIETVIVTPITTPTPGR